MPHYQLHAVDGRDPTHIDSFEANDTEEAIALSVIRLVRRNTELRRDDNTVARFSADGRMERLAG